jgi:glycyl-tRNA synthetase alpha chain
VISVTERQAFILRVRELARAVCAAWLKTEAGGAMLDPREGAHG